MNSSFAVNSMADFIYNEYLKKGLLPEDAKIKTINDINNMTSDSMDKEVLEQLKKAFFNIPGVI